MVTDELYCWCGDPGVGTVVMLLLPGAAAAAGRDCLYKFLLPAPARRGRAAARAAVAAPLTSAPPRRDGVLSGCGVASPTPPGSVLLSNTDHVGLCTVTECRQGSGKYSRF